jgi:VCBS repeat-containing protein
VLANDTDPNGCALTATLLHGPKHGTLTINANGSFTYTPKEGFRGTDSFTYQANDGHGGTASATVTLKIAQDTKPGGPGKHGRPAQHGHEPPKHGHGPEKHGHEGHEHDPKAHHE